MSTTDERAEFEVWQGEGDDSMYVAGTGGPREQAWRDAQHYAMVYAQDGPVRVCEVTRKWLHPEVIATPAVLPECAASGGGCEYGAHGPNGAQQCRYCGESAAPVDARDALEQLFDLAKQYGYKLTPTTRAAIAAAPAEGEK